MLCLARDGHDNLAWDDGKHGLTELILGRPPDCPSLTRAGHRDPLRKGGCERREMCGGVRIPNTIDRENEGRGRLLISNGGRGAGLAGSAHVAER